MWQVKTEILQANQLIKYHIYQKDQAISQAVFLNSLITDGAFRSFYNQLLKENPFKGYYWENPAFSLSSTKQAYEFVLISNPFFEHKLPDTQSFKAHFNVNQPVVIFQNLSKDATLVVPTPQGDSLNYVHLAKFVHNAPSTQIDAFWQKVGLTVSDLLSEKKVWLNTEGTGVFWLHARIDRRPKYYKYAPYRI